MSTDWKAILRKSAPTLSRDDIERMTDQDARNYYWGTINPANAGKPKDKRKVVCFTGFTAQEEILLAAMADKLSFRIVISVTSVTSLLVCGPNAGPKKIEKARSLAIRIVSEAEFEAMAIEI